MSQAQFDEVFQKLEKVIKEIITKQEYVNITGQKFYDKFKVEFGLLSSPAIRTGIKLQKDTIIKMFDSDKERINEFKELCNAARENMDHIDSFVKTIISVIVAAANNNELDAQWKRYKYGTIGGKRKASKTIRKNSKTIRKTKSRKWSQKYKNSINCKRPKGFSQKQHCKYGRKK
jgi:hypothetical protein